MKLVSKISMNIFLPVGLIIIAQKEIAGIQYKTHGSGMKIFLKSYNDLSHLFKILRALGMSGILT